MKALIGYDGSEYADLAIKDLMGAGLPPDTQAVVLAVADVWPYLPMSAYDAPEPSSLSGMAPTVQRAHELAQEAMTEARALAKQGAKLLGGTNWQVQTQAEAGSPVPVLVEEAEKAKADLVVVGSHGRSALGRLVMGSVSQGVVQHARCSVRVGRRPQAAGGGPVKIVLGMDGSVDAREAVKAAAARRWPEKSVARVVVALDRVLLTAIPEKSEAQDRAWIEREADWAAEVLGKAGLGAEVALIEGEPRKVIPEQAEQWQADCIFLGAKGLAKGRHFLLGSVSSAVAARAVCSVEVIRQRPGAISTEP